MKKFTLFIFCCVMLLLSGIHNVNAQTPVQQNGQLQVIGLKLCNQYGNPIQLRGMSTHGLQWYGLGDCITDASLDALANDWEADVLRISLYVQEGGYDTDPAGFTQMVSTIIDKVTARGMYALVDWHQLTRGDPNANLAKAKTFFTAIANAHKNKNNILYDICNEPNNVSWSAIRTYANALIPVIRAIDADAPILIGTHGWASFGVSSGGSAQDILNNPVNHTNIMYTFHFYAASHGSDYLNELSWAADRMPVFVTEFGTQEASGDGGNNFTRSQQYIDLMRNKKISWCNWNYSDDSRSGAVWLSGTCSSGPWTVARLKPAGVWVRERMKVPADDFPGGGNPNPCLPATASADDGNVAANVLDNDLNTRWSASGDGQWIQFCLNDTLSVTGVQIAFYNGNVRTSTFDVLVGNDGTSWTTAASGRVSSGTSTALETFTFTAVSGKYVRIVGHGNSVNLWNSYTEVKIQTGTGGGGTFTLTPEADAYVRDGTNASTTYGTTDPTLLITKVAPSGQLNNARESYLRFDLASVSGTVSSATLRVYGKVDLTTVPSVPIGVYSVANTTWSESALTWNNKPASGAGLDTNTVTNSAYAYISFDVTSYVQSELAASRSKVSFAMKSLTAHDPRVFWNSKEFGSNAPQLVVQTATGLQSVTKPLTFELDAPAVEKLRLTTYPNPFHGSSIITFHLDRSAQTNLTVYDVTGRRVAVLVNNMLHAGNHRVVFQPEAHASGVYILRMNIDGRTTTRKLVKE
jgi:endoglucanase